MLISDCIWRSPAVFTFLGLITVWVQPKLKKNKREKVNENQLRKHVSLYFDIFEIKLEREISLLKKREKLLNTIRLV